MFEINKARFFTSIFFLYRNSNIKICRSKKQSDSHNEDLLFVAPVPKTKKSTNTSMMDKRIYTPTFNTIESI